MALIKLRNSFQLEKIKVSRCATSGRSGTKPHQGEAARGTFEDSRGQIHPDAAIVK